MRIPVSAHQNRCWFCLKRLLMRTFLYVRYTLKLTAGCSIGLKKVSARRHFGLMECRAYYVNHSWLEKQKDLRQEGGVPLVSSNDVLTSWCFKQCGCRAGFVTVNGRGRLPGLGEEHAGNYFFFKRCLPEEFSSPAGIRCKLLDNSIDAIPN